MIQFLKNKIQESINAVQIEKESYFDSYLTFLTDPDKEYHGYTLNQIWNFTDDELEYKHDFIQLLFPLEERSMYSFSAPVLTLDQFKLLKNNPQVVDNLLKSFDRMLKFYGFYRNGDMIVNLNTPFVTDLWKVSMDHNFLRITRILHCLYLCGLKNLAQNWLILLSECISSDTFNNSYKSYWYPAVYPD